METQEGGVALTTVTRLLVLYSAEPGRGSEPGVGWGFLRVSARRCKDRAEQLIVVLRSDDVKKCELALLEEGLSPAVTLVGVDPIRGLLGSLAGGRLAYLFWQMKVRRLLQNIPRDHMIVSVHQANWGTALLPPAIPRSLRGMSIWGPVAVPRFAGKTLVHEIANKSFGLIARRNGRGMRIIVANNSHSERVLQAKGQGTQIILMEPHIFAEARPIIRDRDERLLSVVGLLIRRKRVDLAIRALATETLSDFRLQVLGDGPERDKLRKLAKRLGVDNRVIFLGWLPREQVIETISVSAALIHPSSREGAGFAVGEAAAVGVPSVVFEDTGASTVVSLSENGGKSVSQSPHTVENLARAILEVSQSTHPGPVKRWSADRFDSILNEWWELAQQLPKAGHRGP